MEDKRKCPDCGAELQPGDNKCPSCFKEIDIITVDNSNPAGPTMTEERFFIKEQPQESKPSKQSKGPWIIVAILIALLVGACIWFFVFYTGKAAGGGGGGGGGGGASSDGDKETEKTDSAAKDTAATGDTGAVPMPVAEVVAAVSPDLAFNGLTGPVKLVTNYNVYGDVDYVTKELFYTPTGQWINEPMWDGGEQQKFPGKANKVERDGKGYISYVYQLEYEEGDDEGTPTTVTYLWKDGRISQIIADSNYNDGEYYSRSQTIKDLTYDDKGNLIKESATTETNSSWGSSTSTEETVYTYSKFDDRGNWTERSVSSRYRYEDAAPYTNSYMEKREILYY